MKKLVLFLIGSVLLNSCNVQKEEKKYVLYVRFQGTVNNYYFESIVKSDTMVVGDIKGKHNIINQQQNIYNSLLEISFKEPVPLRSRFVFEVIDDFNNARVKIFKSMEKESYSNGDTLVGGFESLPSPGETSSNIDSLSKKVDPVVKEIFRLNKTKPDTNTHR